MEQDTIKLRVSGVSKSFPGVKALDNINFSVRKGTLHALCGENGAGKSTLMKIINGLYKADEGKIFIDGQETEIRNPIQAREKGIAMIAQELNYVPEMSVEENIFLGRLPVNRAGRVEWRKVREETLKLLKRENLPYSPTQKLKSMTVSDIQMLEILKAISNNAQVVIMDEPTSAITNREVETLFGKIGELKNQGVSIIYISHKMEEVFRIADDITVLRDGQTVWTKRADETNLDEVITAMVGRRMENAYPKKPVTIGRPVLEVENLCSKGVFEKISFNVHAGEIVGFAGLMGAGRTETMRALFGLDSYDTGAIRVNSKPVHIHKVSDAIKNKLVMLSEDRRRYGIIPVRSVMENASISSLDKIIYGGMNHPKVERELVSEYFKKMNVKTPSLETLIQALSGGNQQKVLLAKWMLRDPDVLILDEPTRGIDVGAKFEIYRLMTDMVEAGKAVVMVSSELPELIGMCDRIYVMSKGHITGCLARKEFSQEAIMKFAMS